MKKLTEITKAKLKTPDVSTIPVEEMFSKINRPEDFKRKKK